MHTGTVSENSRPESTAVGTSLDPTLSGSSPGHFLSLIGQGQNGTVATIGSTQE